MGVSFPCHLGKVGLAVVLNFSTAHLGLHAADDSLLAGVISSQAGLLDTVLDLNPCQKLPLLVDFIGALLEFLAQGANSDIALLGSISVWMHVLVHYIILHPVDVEGARLGTRASINRLSALSLFLNCFDHF